MTLTEAQDPAVAGPASRFVIEQQQASLSDAVEQLAALRFSILLSAKWENSGLFGAGVRADMRDELGRTRNLYNNKIDEIAMNYGVQAAIQAKEGVEREVSIPKNMMPPRVPKQDDRVWF
jgi:hypothetical protein